jgi:hypothetical protein
MKLKPKQLCPLHRRRDCCGRAEFVPYAQVKKPGHGIWQPVSSGLWRAPDGREKASKAVLRRRKDSLLRQGVPCAACGNKFSDYREVELAHRVSCGAGGYKRNDAMSNLTLMCAAANRDQGSMDLEIYLATKYKPEICRGGVANV